MAAAETLAPRSWVWVLAAAAAAATAFGPWVRTGRVVRSGFELARSAERLDVVDGGAAPLLLAVWFCVPLLAAVSFTAAAFGRWHVSALAATLTATAVLGVTVLVLRTPLATEWGVTAGLGAAGICLATLAVDAVLRRQVRR